MLFGVFYLQIIMGAMADEASDEYEVDKILNKRKVKGVVYYLVKWKGYGNKDSTWEPEAHLNDLDSMIEEFNERRAKKGAKKTAHKRISKRSIRKSSGGVSPATKPTKKLKTNGRGRTVKEEGKNETIWVDNSVEEASRHHNPPCKAKSPLVVNFNRFGPSYSNEFKAERQAQHYGDSMLETYFRSVDKRFIQIADHYLLCGKLYLLLDDSSRPNSGFLGYFPSDAVKVYIPIQLCEYYERFVE